MPALNRVQLIGRLGRDPESKFTPTGKESSSFLGRRQQSLEGPGWWLKGIHRMGERGSLGTSG